VSICCYATQKIENAPHILFLIPQSKAVEYIGRSNLNKYSNLMFSYLTLQSSYIAKISTLSYFIIVYMLITPINHFHQVVQEKGGVPCIAVRRQTRQIFLLIT